MKMKFFSILIIFISLISACVSPVKQIDTGGTNMKVLAVESILADISQNVAGKRIKVDSLIPQGIDPHEFEPAPADIAKIAGRTIIVVNGGGLEPWLDRTLSAAGGQQKIILASAGLASRKPSESEENESTKPGVEESDEGLDPHFWLDPNLVITYVQNIRDGLIAADPYGKDEYTRNAEEYISQLKELDGWINDQVSLIPAERRLLVTNHESIGYYADRYGFKIIGTIVPSFSSLAAPSAQQIAQLIDLIQANHVKAIFLETGSNQMLAEQIANETGAKVINDLYTHSLSSSTGPAPTYIDMMRFDTQTIVNALNN
jgi:ABC-type Zn uptake system ZnuABC Zn-binding protein ZnuA